MDTKEVGLVLREIINSRLNQGYAVRVGTPDYHALLLTELNKLENFYAGRKEELVCLSKCIRRYLWKDNSAMLYQLISKLNAVSEIFADIVTPENYWNLDIIVDYVMHLFLHRQELRVTNVKIYETIIDEIQTAGTRATIEKQWEDILAAEDGNKAFINIFDDLFQNAIEKYENEFIYHVEDKDILCRMVTESSCTEERFIPWPNKAQNRWNPPGKTYLYLSYTKNDKKFDADIHLSEYICLLECKLEKEEDVCFCRFKPTKSGRILDLSYNDITLFELRQEINEAVQQHANSLIGNLLSDNALMKKRYDDPFVKAHILEEMDRYPFDREIIAKNSAKQILKLICSCIYKKVDEKDDAALEKAYKSFHILASYLEVHGITGIVYPCTRTKKIVGKNIVLFNIEDAEPIKGTIKPYHFTNYWI